jgi:polar amino acid transport system substrate-binding protein
MLWLVLVFGALLIMPAGHAQIGPGESEETILVVTKPLEPFVIYLNNGELAGFSIDLWEAIAQDLGLEYEWVRVDEVTEQLEAVENDQADVAIAGISMTPEREQVIDFSHPYFDAGLQIMTSAQPELTPDSLLTIIFSPALLRVFGLGLLTLLVMAHVIWLTERRSNPTMPDRYLSGIWESLWWSLSTIATLEYGDKEKPRGKLKRLLAMALVVFSIILIAQFTASITASLTVQQLTGVIEGPTDLPGKRIATVEGSTSALYLESIDVNYTGVGRIEEAYELLESDNLDAIVFDAPVLLYYSANEGNGKVQVVGSIFQRETYGIALPTGSSLREPINNELLRLRQNGTYDQIYEKWFGREF